MSTRIPLKSKIFQDSYKSFLMEMAIKRNEGRLGPNGEFIIETGKHTGRAANDKYVVSCEETENKIWWENNIKKMNEETFEALEKEVLDSFNLAEEVFSTNRSIGNPKHYCLGIQFVSTEASAALFSQYMFKPEIQDNKQVETFQILHAPRLVIDPKKYNTRSETIIVTCFKRRKTLIIGTFYAGEIKKSMFSVMNFLVPDLGILPMHSGANQNKDGETFVFFGLSGTGKTTLSTDLGLDLIGDDEHGLSEKGVFNFEGGCYAKTFKLSLENEPEIYRASTQFSSFLENVMVSEDRKILNFDNDSITENGRSSYPLEFLTGRVISGEGKIPKDIFYLSADAFGVLPPVSLLSSEQAMSFFELGYSAKLAGTELGVIKPEATFSACFGAPFMLRRPEVYSSLLKKLIATNDIKVWLINTGWFGGGYGTGKRFPLKVTRNIIRQIQASSLDDTQFINDKIFGLKIPQEINGVESSYLFPENSWEDKKAYAIAAKELNEKFEKQKEKLKKSL